MNCRARKDRSYQECDEETAGSFRGWASSSLALALILPFFLTGILQAGDKEPAMIPKSHKKGSGTLVIVGGGMLPETIRTRFIELAGGPNARLVVIPTASRRAEPGHLEELNSYADWAPFARAGKVKSLYFLHTRRLDQANDPTFVKPLTEASGVWFAGGDQSLLMAAYKGTSVEKEVRGVLARGGVIGGTSAGAAVMSDVMIRYGNPVAELGTGFGFFPGVVVDQHFQERNRLPRLLGVIAKHPRCLGIGIDEQTGVIVQGQSVTVLGKSHVRVCFRGQEMVKPQVKVFTSGARIDLIELQRAMAALPMKTPVGPQAAKTNLFVGPKVH